MYGCNTSVFSITPKHRRVPSEYLFIYFGLKNQQLHKKEYS